MPSRADGRRFAEWVMRAVVVGGLAVALRRSVHPAPRAAMHASADARTLHEAIHRASVTNDVGALTLTLDVAPTRIEREWLRALRRAGVEISWTGGPAALAMQVSRTTEPVSRVRVALAGDPVALALSDSVGAIDSVRLTEVATTPGSTTPRRVTNLLTGAMLTSPAVVGAVAATGARAHASGALPPARTPRAVLVLGRAGWEGKFVSAALQEAGWTVRARTTVAPGVVITDPALLPLDTARYDAVVALDSTAVALENEIARFVRAGGGLVLAGDAGALEPLRALAPARAGPRTPGRILLDGDSVSRGDLPSRSLVALRDDAIALEGTATRPLVAVRRAGLGRVVSVGYDESWRWRMLGGASGAAAHREWWSRTTALVAPAGPAGDTSRATDAAPLASLVDALGPSSAVRHAPTGGESSAALPMALFAIIALALLAELASRRFRGAR